MTQHVEHRSIKLQLQLEIIYSQQRKPPLENILSTSSSDIWNRLVPEIGIIYVESRIIFDYCFYLDGVFHCYYH